MATRQFNLSVELSVKLSITGGFGMQTVTKLSQAQFDLYMKYKGKFVSWKRGAAYKHEYGTVVGIYENYLLVKDDCSTLGVLESEIVWVSK